MSTGYSLVVVLVLIVADVFWTMVDPTSVVVSSMVLVE